MLFANQISISENKQKYPVGIHVNNKVASIDVGDTYIDFNYESADGNYYANKRVWFPDINKITPKDNETPQTALQRVTNESLAHIVKHLHLFLPVEQVNSFSAPDFPSFAQKAKEVLTPHLDSKRVNLKLIYDYEGVYSTFGYYPDYIELYVEGQEPKIRFSNWEKLNRSTPKTDDTIVVAAPTQSAAQLF